jgi:Tol biopolymer transport system component
MASAQASQFSVSRSGSLVYVPNASLAERSLVWVERTGQTKPAASAQLAYGSPRIAPDGRRIAFLTYDGLNPRDISVYDPQSLVVTRLTTEGLTNTVPVWSPDGRRVVFSSVRDASQGRQNLFMVPSDAAGTAERLTESDHIQLPMSWAPDGHTLVYAEIRPETQYDIFAVNVTDHSIRTIAASPGNDIGASVSPDGRYVAYCSDESGQSEVYVQSFPMPGHRWRISRSGGTEPAWSNAGELFYRSGDRMMAVRTTPTADGLSFSEAQALFEGRFERTILTPGIRMYDVTADGQRFLMVKATSATAPGQLRLVANWITELRSAFALSH